MSYLDAPRLHFSGWFQADVSTINNRVEAYQNDSFVPQYQELDHNNSWNPDGTGIFRFMDCSVTGGFVDGRLLTSAAQDPVIGLSLQNADRRAPGKLVDLDPQQQMVSEIWGMQLRLVNGAAQSLMQGEYKPAAFINLWKRQLKSMPGDQTLAAYYQSVLEGVAWPDITGSPLLDALKAATQEDMLSIEFNVYGYGRDSKIPRYTLGHIVGTIGPYRSGEPKHFVQGRQLVADTSNFPLAAQGVGSAQAKVSQDGMWLTVDLGNSFPIEEANSGLADIGPVSIGVLNTSPDSLQTTVEASQVTLIGTVPYLEPQWYTQTAGVQSFDLSGNAAARQLLPSCPLVVLTPLAGSPDSYTVLVQESIEGLYVRADQFVFRVEPGQTQTVDFYASQFGAPLANAAITTSVDNSMIGGSGGNGPMEPPPHPPAPVPAVGTPEDAISYASSITTDARGHATLALTASAAGPGTPRGYISGQLYGVGYQLAAQPAGYVGNMVNFLSVMVYTRNAVPAQPTWYGDIQPLFTQYAHLYPIMSRYVVDLSDYASVASRVNILKLAFSLDIRDPNHMPVTRDLGASDRATILKWLDTPGPDGLPLLGTPPPAPSPSPAPAAGAAPLVSAPAQPAVQGGGKTAVIHEIQRRRASAAANPGGTTP